MKKLLLVAAIAVAGLVSAKNVKIEFETNSNSITKNYFNNGLMISKLLVYQWVPVSTGCGKVFYLDNSMYGDCYECLQEDARKFTDAQCGGGYGFDLPF